MPIILIGEPIHERGTRILENYGRVVRPPATTEEALLPFMAEADALVVRALVRVNRKLLEAAPRLKVVGRHGIGVDNIDVDAATDLGIWVVNTPDAPTEPVAQHFVMMALMLAKKIWGSQRVLRTGEWNTRMSFPGMELTGRTIGIAGFGRIGRRIAQICGPAFSAQILYSDVVACPELEASVGARRVSLEELLKESDFVSLNVPLIPQTHHMIGARQIAMMKPTAYLLNLCRGPVWDENAVLEALKSGRIAGAATDVFEEEPCSPDHPLLKLENFIATPHNSSATGEALERMSLVAEDIVAVLDGRQPQWPVNNVRNSARHSH